MKEERETLIDWLRDAHAMECNLVKMLEKQSKHLDEWPHLKQRIDRHLEESRHHATRVAQCLEELGSDTSAVKDGIAKLSGLFSQTSMGMATDEPVKICLGNYAIEHFEMACYRSLRSAAQECGETQIAAVAEDILREEESMAEFIEAQIEDVTIQFLHQSARV